MDDTLHRTVTRLTQLSIPRALAALALPIVLANTLLTAHQLVNTFWVGRLGAPAVAAVSVSFPVIFLLVSVGGGLSVAGSILIAQYAGARDSRSVNHVSAQTMLMVVAVSALFSALGYPLAGPLLHAMGIGADIFEESTRYLQVSFLGIVFMFAFETSQSILRGVGEVKIPLYVIAFSVVLNLILDPLFIFGLGPVPAGGVVGAAYATLVTQGLAAAVGLAVLLRNRYGVQLRRLDFVPDIPLIRRIFRLGLPASVEQSAVAERSAYRSMRKLLSQDT